jgi:hypothetical protein
MIFLIAVFITAMSYAASITVTNPHSGTTWHQGTTYTITWTKSGTMNANVKIRLYQGSTKVLNITNSTPNDGSYSWPIPSSLPDGSYVIRVKTLDNAVFDDSDSFNIAHGVPAGSITVTNPHSGDCWQKGNTYIINWTHSGHATANVKIRLYQGSSLILPITNSTSNDGSYSWSVPATISEGSYMIRVKTVDNNFYDDSDSFNISNSCGGDDGTPSINLGNFRASMNLVELAIFMHGPGPRIRGIGGIRNVFEKANFKQPVTMKLMKGKMEVMNFGTFKPVVRRGRVVFNTMPSMFNLRLSPKQREMIQAHPQEYRLVIMSKGEVLLNKALRVKAPKRGKVINSKLTMINPNIVKNARFIKKCPDLAVVDIKFTIVRKYSQFRGRVRITGIVKNVGNADYISHKGQQAIILDKGDSRYRLKRVDFKDLKVGKTIKISYERDWNSSSPNEGEFPPTYRVYLSYDPDIGMDNLKTNDDCNPNNNSKTKNGKAINDMLR